MCGFVGFTDLNNLLDNKKEILTKMMDRIVHRGPDMAGEFCNDNVALGFRRLSIIDLSENACQPLYNEDKTVAVVFNGEIYNFMEIRAELIEKGHKLETEGDSEVLVHAYEEYGTDMLKRLRGMFAFVIYDSRSNLLFGTRDIFGIKPHYYYITEDGDLLFGSEIKAFLEHPRFIKEVNKDALRPYLTFQYSSGEDTFWKGVKKLPPACYYIFKDGKMTFGRYWDEEFSAENKTFDEYVEIIDKTVNESVAAHRISDVRVGSFLSGGVDSSYITACLMPDETFSVGFIEGEGKFNETTYAKELSDRLGIENYKKIITPDECFEAFPEIQYHMDEPQSNPSSVPLYFLAQLAREHVTVVLSGEGADELFAGYDWYADTKEVRKFKKIVPGFVRRALASMVKPLPPFKGKSFLLRSSGRPEDYFFGQALVFSAKEAPDFLAPDCRGGRSAVDIVMDVYREVADKDELTKKQQLDMRLWLPGDILLKADKMSMAHSLELRVPFLDKVVMEMAEKIPHSYKVCEKDTKYVFRKAANKTLPDEWADRKKQGFPVPIRIWLTQEKYYNTVKEYFNADFASEFFNVPRINALLEDHYSGKCNNGRKIWTVFTFLVWYKRFFIDEK